MALIKSQKAVEPKHNIIRFCIDETGRQSELVGLNNLDG